MAVPTFQMGRLVLREDFTAADGVAIDGSQALSISGQESMPRWSAAGIAKQREDFLSMQDKFVPVIFSGKTYLNGFYKVVSVQGDVTDFIPENLKVFAWSLGLWKLGTQSSLDIESRLSGAEARSNNFSSTGERTHAPAIGHDAYWAGASIPSSIVRASADGNITVYRDVAFTVHPRWAVSPEQYGLGRVRIEDAAFERAGTNISMDPEAWTLSNGLVRVVPNAPGGTITFSAWDSGAWVSRNWDILVGSGPAVSLGAFDYCTIIRNEFEMVTLRMIKSTAIGRVMLDMTLRRGSRIVELFVQTTTSTTVKVVMSTTTAVSQLSGYVVATADDGDGNRATVGAAKTFTADLVNGGISRSGTLEFDAYIGLAIGGGSAVSGEAAGDLFEQYIGMPTETVRGVTR
jgi:hypothetical protein